MVQRSVGVLMTLALVALYGCATGGRGLSEDCRSDLARNDSSVGETLDSAALQVELEELWTPTTGFVLASFNYDSLGVQDTVRIWSDSISESSRAHLELALLKGVNQTGTRASRVYLFIGDGSGPRLRRVERFLTCEPKMVEEPNLSEQIGWVGWSLGLVESRAVLLLAHVQADGGVKEVRVKEGSGHLAFDVEAAKLLRDARFKPGMIEGIRVPVWVSVPVKFNPGRR